jgi:hypothetical protein
MRLVSVIYCHTFVSPGMGATLHTTLVRRVLITDDFPTFGYPTNPTDIACLSLFKRASCRRRERREPCSRTQITALISIVTIKILFPFCSSPGSYISDLICISISQATLNSYSQYRKPRDVQSEKIHPLDKQFRTSLCDTEHISFNISVVERYLSKRIGHTGMESKCWVLPGENM